MPIQVIKKEPKAITVLWKDVNIGDVYRYEGILAMAVRNNGGGQHPRAVALDVTPHHSSSTKVGDVWAPGENSEWTPMLATLTVEVQYED
jgi:hypothetical protein